MPQPQPEVPQQYGHPSGVPQCACCYYRVREVIPGLEHRAQHQWQDENIFTPGWYWNEQQASTVPRVGWCVGWDWWHGEAPHGSARLSSARLRSAQHQHESPNSSDGTTLELEAGSALLALE